MSSNGAAAEILKCPYGGATIKERVDRLRADFEEHERDQRDTVTDIYDKLNAILTMYSNRLPPWGTAFVSILCTLLGICIGVIGMLVGR